MNTEDKEITKSNNRLLAFISSNRIISLMTVSVPALYLLGYFHTYGYQIGFGMSGEFFPKSIQEHLVGSFIVIFLVVVDLWVYLRTHFYVLLLFFAVVFVFSFVAIYFLRNPVKFKFDAESRGGDVPERLYFYVYGPLKISVLMLATPYIVLCILISIVALPWFSYNQGKDLALGSIEHFEGCELAELSRDKSCIFLSKQTGDIANGMFVARSESHIAIWNGAFTEVFPTAGLKYEFRFGTKADDETQ
ncbi:hypothetical protein ACRRS0_03440 [Agarivorans sp. QJM3NY_29]|uniref:hypothetical protein n=1 Tax=unclassified Agarivorans TaxID=2636026 RepID=UPI003D7E6F16